MADQGIMQVRKCFGSQSQFMQILQKSFAAFYILRKSPQIFMIATIFAQGINFRQSRNFTVLWPVTTV
jgi:hypothetical protein